MAKRVRDLLHSGGDSCSESAKDCKTVFVDTSLNTHLAMPVSVTTDTVSDFKKKLVLGHMERFPEIGEVKIHSLKVKRRGKFYHLHDILLVRSLFCWEKGDWFLTAELQGREMKRTEVLGNASVKELNLSVGLHVDAGTLEYANKNDKKKRKKAEKANKSDFEIEAGENGESVEKGHAKKSKIGSSLNAQEFLGSYERKEDNALEDVTPVIMVENCEKELIQNNLEFITTKEVNLSAIESNGTVRDANADETKERKKTQKAANKIQNTSDMAEHDAAEGEYFAATCAPADAIAEEKSLPTEEGETVTDSNLSARAKPHGNTERKKSKKKAEKYIEHGTGNAEIGKADILNSTSEKSPLKLSDTCVENEKVPTPEIQNTSDMEEHDLAKGEFFAATCAPAAATADEKSSLNLIAYDTRIEDAVLEKQILKDGQNVPTEHSEGETVNDSNLSARAKPDGNTKRKKSKKVEKYIEHGSGNAGIGKADILNSTSEKSPLKLSDTCAENEKVPTPKMAMKTPQVARKLLFKKDNGGKGSGDVNEAWSSSDRGSVSTHKSNGSVDGKGRSTAGKSMPMLESSQQLALQSGELEEDEFVPDSIPDSPLNTCGNKAS